MAVDSNLWKLLGVMEILRHEKVAWTEWAEGGGHNMYGIHEYNLLELYWDKEVSYENNLQTLC